MRLPSTTMRLAAPTVSICRASWRVLLLSDILRSRSARQGCTRRLKHSHRNDLTARIYRFKIRHSHYWTKGVVIHRARDPILPSTSACDPALRKIMLSQARLALQEGGSGCHVGPPKLPKPTRKGGSTRSKARAPPEKGGSSCPGQMPPWADLLRRCCRCPP